MEVELPKIVMLTAGDINGRRLSHVLKNMNITFSIITTSHSYKKRGRKALLIFLFDRLRSLIASIGFLRNFAHRNRPKYSQPSTYCGVCNSYKLKQKLAELNPDYILMMGGGILDEEVIGLARKGVLNVHPGLLPWVRGLSAIGNSILNDIPVGLTAHFIDKGIDTGDIIKTYALPIKETDSFKDIYNRSNHACVAAMAKLSKEIIEGNTPKNISVSEKYPLMKRLNKADTEKVEKLIKNQAPQQVYKNLPNEKFNIDNSLALLDEYESWWPSDQRF